MNKQMGLFDKPTNICKNYHVSTEAVLVQGVEGGKLQSQFLGIQKPSDMNLSTTRIRPELMDTKG